MKVRALTISRRLAELAWATAAVAIALSAFWRSLTMGAPRLDVPLIYAGDTLAYIYTYDILRQPLAGAASVTGMPFGSNLYDAPNADAFNLTLVRALELLTGQFGAAFNLYVFATVVIVGACAYAVGRRLGLQPIWACALSILFNLLPFHIQRIWHLFFLNYAPAAVATWLALDVVSSHGDAKRRSWLLICIAAIFCGCSGIYYAFFSCLFLLVASAVAFFADPAKKAAALRGLIITGLIIATSAINLLPSLWYQSQNGPNPEVVQRAPEETELYSLKLSQMLLPVEGHRIKAWGDLSARYGTKSPIVNENKSVALGIVGSAGFIILLLAPFLASTRWTLPEHVRNAAPLAWTGFLWGTVGGLGTLFAWFVSPQLHGANRISIFLGFLALFAFFACMQMWTSRLRRPLIGAFIAVVIVAIGILDTTPTNYSLAGAYPDFQARFDSDKRFAEDLDSHLYAGSMLFQLPYLDYPEGSPAVALRTYDLVAPIVHSKHLRWTFGAMRGRADGRWYKIVASLDPEKLTSALQRFGFAGIVVNRKGYTDQAVELEKTLQRLGLKKEVTSPDEIQVMYALPEPAAAAHMALAMAPGKGWYPLESLEDRPVIWSRGDAQIIISNVAANRSECKATLSLSSLVPRTLSLVDGDRTLAKIIIRPGQTANLAAIVEVVPGQEKHLTIRTDAPPSSAGGADNRLVGFMWDIGSEFSCD